MATRKKPEATLPPPLATDDEAAVFEAAQNALSRAQNVSVFEDMRDVAGTLHHALAVIEGMRGRHVTAVHQRIGQEATLRLASMRDLTHRLIVFDEQRLGAMAADDPLRAEVEADLEQRREWIRQLTKLHEAVTQ